MLGNIFPVLFFLLFWVNAQAQSIPNASFEQGSGDSATGWRITSGDAERIFLQEFKQSNSLDTQYAYRGRYFMRLTTIDTIVNGEPLADVGSVAQVFSYSHRPKYIEFWAMYLPKSVSDRFSVHLVMTHWNIFTGQRDIVLNYGVNSDSNRAYYPWTKFSAPINYLNAIMPDTMAISLSSAGTQENYGVGATFWIDSIVLIDSAPPGIILNSSSPFQSLNIYPNPCRNSIHISYFLSLSAEVNFSIFNLTGKEILSTHFSNAAGYHQTLIPLQNIKPGMYIGHLSTLYGNVYRKIVVSP